MRSEEIKPAAAGRWAAILRAIAPQLNEALERAPRHVHCPLPGHEDNNPSFRLSDVDNGKAICTCGAYDGFGLIQQLNGWSFVQALEAVGVELGFHAGGERLEVSIMQRIAWEKRVSVESLKAYGGAESERNGSPSVRVPMFDADGEVCSHFDVLEKGKGLAAKGLPAGLFLPVDLVVAPGERWFLVEGVKDACALHRLGHQVAGTCTDHLPRKYRDMFAGCDVVIIPDRTVDAEVKARKTAGILWGVARSIHIVTLPLDIAERSSMPNDVRDCLKLKDGRKLLASAIENAALWTPHGERAPKRPINVRHAAEARWAEMEAGDPPRLQTVIPGVDASLGGGIRWGSLVVIGARPSHGKSMLALQLCHNVTREGHAALFISLDMSQTQIVTRIFEFASVIPKGCWGSQLADLKRHVIEYCDRRKTLSLLYDCRGLGEIEQAISAAVDRGTKLVVIDYAQKIKAEGQDKRLEMNAACEGLLSMAIDHEIVICALSQLNRDVTKKSRPPTSADFKESAAFEENANVCLLLHYPHRENPEKYAATDLKIILAKNQDGEILTPVINAHYEPDRQRIVSKSIPGANSGNQFSEELGF